MNLFQSIFLGAVQGITEFLPISSSGHLVLVPYIFKWQYNGLSFDIALHMGTVAAIVGYFWKDWMMILKKGLGIRAQDSGQNLDPKTQDLDAYPSNFLWQIVIASIPAALAGYLIADYVETVFHSPLILAANLVVFGIFLYLIDRFSKSNFDSCSVGLKQSLLVGLAQCLALIPGVSRSGITMIASRSLGFEREKAARFSFLLGTPAMIGAFLFAARDLRLEDLDLSFFFGVLASTLFGFLAIKYLLQYLKRGSFSIFMWYRIALAVIILLIYFGR